MEFEETFDRYLTESIAGKSSKTLDELRDKLFCIRRLKELFPELEGFIIEEGVPDTEEREPIFFDFIIRKEEVEFGIFIEVTQEQPKIESERISALIRKLNMDPLLSAIIIVWNDETLSSCALDGFGLQKYFGVKEGITSLDTEKIDRFVEIVNDFYNQQFVDWQMLEDSMFPDTLDIPEARFLEIITNCLHRELEAQITSKTFRLKEKEEAKSKIVEDDIEKTILFLKRVFSKEKISEADLKTIIDFYTRLSEEQ